MQEMWGEKVVACEECPNRAGGEPVCVGSSGPREAEVLILGERPGAEEAEQGRPFVGASGRWLDRLLEMGGLERKECRAANVVSCYLVGNPAPRAGELKACKKRVGTLIEETRPSVILAIGGKALAWFFPKAKITREQGRAREWEGGVRVIPLLHPAGAMRVRSRVPELVESFKRLPEEMRRDLSASATTYRLASAEDVLAYLAGAREFAFDYETTEPMRGRVFTPGLARPLGFSVAVREGEALYCASGPGVIRHLLEDSNITKICHNAKFEVEVSKGAGITLRNFQDTKLMAYVLGYESTHLKDLSLRILGVRQMRLEELKEKYGVKRTEELTPEQWVEYAAADADLTLRLYRHLREELT